jgi:hypothetical protein
MPIPISRSIAALMLLGAVACSDSGPKTSPPKAIHAVTPTSLTGTVGQPVDGGITVRVIDYNDRSAEGVKVSFSIINGDGSVSSHLEVTDADGIAHVDWTLGQTAGDNEVLARMFGSDSSADFLATGQPAAAVGLAITPSVVRIATTANGASVTGRVVDQFGNPIAGTATYASRDPGVVTVATDGTITATQSDPAARSGSTWVVVDAGGFTDSARVYTLSPTDPPCTGITAMAPLAVGEVQVTGFVDNGICVPAAEGERQYAFVPFSDTPVPSAQTAFTVTGVGIKGVGTGSLGELRSGGLLGAVAAPSVAAKTRAAVDTRLRVSERREMASRAAGARNWFASREASAPRALRAAAVPNVGDQVQLNVEANFFCSSPSMRTGRVAAVTQRSVVIADMANPAGYSDADYASFGASFDTLAYPIDLASFGQPTDVDDNGGRLVLFFTHAVNEMGSGVLGFAYSRDLLPKSGPIGSCPGSNVAEMLYIRVPDSGLSVAEAREDVVATEAHEFQHVISAGRHLYINPNAVPSEEVWLNEGLSHIAEELAFYRSSGTAPRQNLGAQLSLAQAPFREFAYRNWSRYFLFTFFPGSQGPVGLTDDDDDLETRGAAWSFLRFAADHRAQAGNEAAFWQSLENSNTPGMQNLLDHVGADTRLLARDWALSNFPDDLVPTDEKYTQPSWDLRHVPGFRSPSVLNLVSPTQANPSTSTITVTLGALSSEFIRFAVGTNQEAYVRAAGSPAASNLPLPPHVLLAIVRTK